MTLYLHNLPVGNVDFNNNVVAALKGYFEFVKNNDIQFSNTDFEAFLNSIEITEKDFVYLDPPYLITFSEYNKLWDEDCEMRLIIVLLWNISLLKICQTFCFGASKNFVEKYI